MGAEIGSQCHGASEAGFLARNVIPGRGNRLGHAIRIFGTNIVSGDQFGEDAQAQELCPEEQERDRVEQQGPVADWPVAGSSQITAR